VRVYGRKEVIWLLSLSKDDALEYDTSPPSLLGRVSSDEITASGVDDDSDLFVVVRWRDVQLARKAVRATPEQQQILNRRVAGETEAEIATKVGTSDTTVRRRFASTLDSIMVVLGGDVDEEQDTTESQVSACLNCGERPRARAPAVYRRRRGQPPEEVQAERQLSVCATCARAAARRSGEAPPRLIDVRLWEAA
jgi:hypothetical protein